MEYQYGCSRIRGCPLRSLFRVISGRSLRMMTRSYRMGSIKCPHGTMERLGLLVILRGRLGVAANFGSFVSDAVNFWVIVSRESYSRLGAHVKDGDQTACRHNLIFTHLWCVFQHHRILKDHRQWRLECCDFNRI